jgi:hypothetical protein
MTWVKLDDGFCDHPKVALLPLKARWTHLHGLCYCNRFLTDGFIPVEIAHRWEGAGACATLVEKGLWLLHEGSYEISGYLEWNPSKDDVQEQRRLAEERRAADTDRKRRVRAESGRTNDGTGSGEESSGVSSEKEEFDAFWIIYPRKDAVGAARKAWPRARKSASLEEIMAGAARYRDDPNREAAYTAHGSTWLNQQRWNDPALPPRKGKGRNVGNILALAEKAEGE